MRRRIERYSSNAPRVSPLRARRDRLVQSWIVAFARAADSSRRCRGRIGFDSEGRCSDDGRDRRSVEQRRQHVVHEGRGLRVGRSLHGQALHRGAEDPVRRMRQELSAARNVRVPRERVHDEAQRSCAEDRRMQGRWRLRVRRGWRCVQARAFFETDPRSGRDLSVRLRIVRARMGRSRRVQDHRRLQLAREPAKTRARIEGAASEAAGEAVLDGRMGQRMQRWHLSHHRVEVLSHVPLRRRSPSS